MGGKCLHDGLTDQSKAGRHRLENSRALCEAGRWRGAMYLAGYAVECQMKVQLMTRHGCRTLRDLEETLADRGLFR